MKKLLPITVFSFIIISTGIMAPVFADTAGGWPAECGALPPGGGIPHGPLIANPIGTSVSLNTVSTGTFPNTVTFVLDPGVGSSTQVFLNVPSSSAIGTQFNNLSPGPHTAVVCYVTIVGTGHSDTVNFVISDEVVGGELLPIDSTALLLASAQSFSWMIPVAMSVAGIGLFVVSRKS